MYIIESNIDKNDICICVSNYINVNEIVLWSFDSENECRKEKTKSDIGMWKIKQLKSQ